MQQVDLAYLTSTGDQLRSLYRMNGDMDSLQQYGHLLASQNAIQGLVFNSVYSSSFRVAMQNSATKMLNVLQGRIEKVWPSEGGATNGLSSWEIEDLKNNFAKFEAVLESDLQAVGAYIITQKSGFNTASLVENGSVFFSADLGIKVPEAISDIEQAMRCIALEAPTAAGFHLHRANEAVLRRYWDSVTSDQPRPKQGNMGVYLNKLRELNAGKDATLNQLQSLKDFHRNPLMHPEQSISSTDEAIDLMSAIRCSIGYMLQEISKTPSSPTAS